NDPEESAKYIERIIQTVSHDLREPFRSVEGLCRVFVARTADRVDPDALEIVHLIEVCVKRFDHTLKKLTELARSDTIELERDRYPLRLALDSAKERLHQAIAESNARIVCGRLPTLMVDPDLVVIVFQNLLHNAIKFRRGDACTVHVDARRQGTC